MNTSYELVALVQQERELVIRHDRLARIVAAARACCSPSRFERFARMLRRTPAAC